MISKKAEFPNSSNIASVSWSDGTMTVCFKKGTTYEARGVPEGVFDAMTVAPSVGSYFAKEVKTKYTFLPVGGVLA